MSPPAQRRRKGLTLNPVPRWFPGKGTALLAPPVRLFYSSQVRANLGWWKSHKAPKEWVDWRSAKDEKVAPRTPPPACARMTVAHTTPAPAPLPPR